MAVRYRAIKLNITALTDLCLFPAWQALYLHDCACRQGGAGRRQLCPAFVGLHANLQPQLGRLCSAAAALPHFLPCWCGWLPGLEVPACQCMQLAAVSDHSAS